MPARSVAGICRHFAHPMASTITSTKKSSPRYETRYSWSSLLLVATIPVSCFNAASSTSAKPALARRCFNPPKIACVCAEPSVTCQWLERLFCRSRLSCRATCPTHRLAGHTSQNQRNRYRSFANLVEKLWRRKSEQINDQGFE